MEPEWDMPWQQVLNNHFIYFLTSHAFANTSNKKAAIT